MTKTLTENRWFYTENGIKDASWNIVLKSRKRRQSQGSRVEIRRQTGGHP